MLDVQIEPVTEVTPPPGAALLSDAESYVRRFTIMPSDAAYVASVLWGAATHAHLAFGTFPRLAYLSSEPASGKTRAQNTLAPLCRNPREELDPTGPVLAAMISTNHPTIFLDEVDTIFGTRGSNGAHRQLRGILNAGYKAGNVMTRLSRSELVSVPVFGPVCFAGLGNLPDTLMSRSIVVRMRQRRPEDVCETFSPRQHQPLGAMLGASIGAWVATVMGEISTSWPDLPAGVADRAEECWTPLLAVADAAQGEWPERARAAAVALTLGHADEDVPSPADRLLGDLRMVWPLPATEPARNAPTSVLLAALADLPASPWPAMWAPESAARELAQLLASRGISPRKIRPPAGSPCQGYRWADIAGVAGEDDES